MGKVLSSSCPHSCFFWVLNVSRQWWQHGMWGQEMSCKLLMHGSSICFWSAKPPQTRIETSPCRPGWHCKGLSIESVVENQKITNLWSQKFPNKNLQWGRSCNRNPQSDHNLTSNDGQLMTYHSRHGFGSCLFDSFRIFRCDWKLGKNGTQNDSVKEKSIQGSFLLLSKTTFFLKGGTWASKKWGSTIDFPFPVVVPLVASRLFWGTVPEYAKHTGWVVVNLDI